MGGPQKEEVIMATRNVRATHNKHLRDPEVATEYLNEAQILEQARACALEYEHVAPCGYDTDLYFVR